MYLIYVYILYYGLLIQYRFYNLSLHCIQKKEVIQRQKCR